MLSPGKLTSTVLHMCSLNKTKHKTVRRTGIVRLDLLLVMISDTGFAQSS